MKLSIIVPVYNEEETVGKVVEELKKLNIDKEIIVVDDGSTDNTALIVTKIQGIRRLCHETNLGKGAAVRTGAEHATGDLICPFDADLEYDPNDLIKCMQPILDGKAEVVYGSRRLMKSNKQHSGFSFYLGGVGLTFITNVLFGSNLTDEPTCLKMATREVYNSLNLEGNGFEWEPEMTAKILKRRIPMCEVPIHYYPRSKKEGKKIKWKDGFIAVWTLLKWKVAMKN